jgi:hypothetical protein
LFGCPKSDTDHTNAKSIFAADKPCT